MIRRLLLFAILSMIANARVVAQQSDPGLLTIDRLFNSTEFTPQTLGPVSWLDGGAGYTRLEPSTTAKDGKDVIRYDTETGRREVLIAAERVVPSGRSAPLAIDDYAWSPNGKLLLIFTNTQRVWRLNTRGDYWVLNRETGTLIKLGGEAKKVTSEGLQSIL